MDNINDKKTYWIEFVDKLSIEKDLDGMVSEVMADLCRTFEFGCGFVYVSDHHRQFHLRASYEGYPNSHIPPSLDLSQALEEGLYQQLASLSALHFRDSATADDRLSQILGAFFQATSLVFVPIVDTKKQITAFVGLIDRRSKAVSAQEDLLFTRSVLGILANHIKMKLYQDQAENARRSLERILDNMGVDVYVNDFYTHEILYINHSMAAPYGPIESLLGKSCWETWYEGQEGPCSYCPQHRLIDQDGNPRKTYTWDYQRPIDGAWFRVFSTAFPWVDGRLAQVVSSVDITESKHNEAIVRCLAEYDYLTGLPNRFRLSQYIDEYLQTPHTAARDLYVLFFDIDGFKVINDTLGHEAGDELLIRIGKTLQSHPITRNNSYRYGGDEFVVLVPQGGERDLESVLTFLQEVFSRVWQLPQGEAKVGASIGVSHYPSDDTQTGELIRKADLAMYASKHAGKGRTHFYDRGQICLWE